MSALAALVRTTHSLEWLLTSRYAFGLTTASPLQRAICRLAEARDLGELATDPNVVAAVGDSLPSAGARPKEIVLLSAIRSAKSMFCAAAGWSMARGCDLSMLAHGDMPRVSIVSVYRDNARVIFGHLVGTIMANPWMRALLVGEPKAESITVIHKTGRPVEISVVAGSSAGNTLISRWSAGCLFDEAPRMSSADEHVVNYDDMRRNVIGRLLPGAQLISVGSPWAPFGPIYETVQACWRKPDAPILVVWAPGAAMNPVYWTPERIESLKASDPDVYTTDCMAQFASPEEALYTAAELDRCTRTAAELPYNERSEYTAAIDPGTRGNSWTLVIATRDGRTLRVACARQWTGSKLEPLSPRAVCGEVAEICRRYQVKYVRSDQWMGDALVDFGREYAIHIGQVDLGTEERTKRYLSLKSRLSEGMIDLPPDTYLRNDLLRVKRRPTQRGGVAIHLPLTGDGRHCDYAPATVLALGDWLRDMAPEPLPEEEREARAMRERVKKRWATKRCRFGKTHLTERQFV